MTGRELAMKLLALSNPDLPVAVAMLHDDNGLYEIAERVHMGPAFTLDQTYDVIYVNGPSRDDVLGQILIHPDELSSLQGTDHE